MPSMSPIYIKKMFSFLAELWENMEWKIIKYAHHASPPLTFDGDFLFSARVQRARAFIIYDDIRCGICGPGYDDDVYRLCTKPPGAATPQNSLCKT